MDWWAGEGEHFEYKTVGKKQNFNFLPKTEIAFHI